MRAQIDGTDSQINDKFYVRASGGGQLSASKLEEVVKTLEFVLSSKGSSQGSSLGQRPKFSLSPPFQCARVIYSWMTSNIGLTTVEFNCVGVYSPTCT